MRDYTLAIKNKGRPPKSWRWEAGKNKPVRQSEFFETMSEATRMGKTFEHGRAVPIRERNDVAFGVDRHEPALALFQRYAAARSPSSDQRLDRCSIFPLVEEVTRFLPADDIDLHFQAVLLDLDMSWTFPV